MNRTTPHSIGVGTFQISDKAAEYVNNVLRSERLSYGPYIQEFEKRFAAAHDCKFAIMTNSGTSSLMIALHALKIQNGWQEGDEVILPSVTFVATMNVVIQLGLRPVVVDVDPIYYEMDPGKIERAISPRTRCLMPVHLFGCPCDMEPISAIAAKHGLKIVEDSCETMFTRLNGRSVGSFGDIGCFSTYVAHLLCTGVGGLCTTNDPGLAITLRSLANHGRDSIYLNIDDDDSKSKEEMSLIIQKRFSFVELGYSFRATEMEGALGLAGLEEREPMLAARRNNAAFFTRELKPLEGHLQLPAIRPGAGHAFMMYPVVLRDQPKRELVEYLEARGIETRDMLPLVNQPVYRRLLNIKESDYPVAEWVNKNGFYIGCHQGMSELEREFVVESFNAYFAGETVAEKRACLMMMSRVAGSVPPQFLQNLIESLPLGAFDQKILLDAVPGSQVSEAFRKAGFEILSEDAGKGDLLKKGIQATQCEYVVVCGVDGCDDPQDLVNLLLRLRQGYHIAVASRFLPGGGRDSDRPLSYRSIGNRFFTLLISIVFRNNVTDCNNLLRGFDRKAIEGLGLKTHGDSIMFEMTARALDEGLRYGECTTYERRPQLRANRRNRVMSAVSFLSVLMGIVFRRALRSSPRLLQKPGAIS